MEIVLTGDGSHTLRAPQFDEIYHSFHGAIEESMHVYIRAGLAACPLSDMHIFEMGFGTGLNALLSWKYADENKVHMHYTALELYPVPDNVISQINYGKLLPGYAEKFTMMHQAEWNKEIELSENFTLTKLNQSLTDIALSKDQFNVVYFDAFAPSKQPELWTAAIFKKVYDVMAVNAVLTTYCSKSIVRKDMMSVGFRVEKLQGPHGKRDMVRAWKD